MAEAEKQEQEIAEIKVTSSIDTKELESNLVAETKKVTEEEVEKSLNYDELSEAEKKAVDEFNAKIDVYDSTQILQYGAAAQNKISSFSDSILEDVKTKGAGDTGELLAELVGQIKSFDSSIGEKKGLAKLFYNVKREFNTIVAKYNKIEKNVDTIEKGLDKSKIQLLKDISIFDEMYKKKIIRDYTPLFKTIYGMSTRKAQIKIQLASGKTKDEIKTKTSEGIEKEITVDYTVNQWTENFIDYLRSSMSYCNFTEITDYIGGPEMYLLSESAKNAINK